MKKVKKQTLAQLPVEMSELPKYSNLEITKVKRSSKKKVVKVEKPERFAFKDIQSDLEALMKEEVDEDMEEQKSIKKDKQSNLEEVPLEVPRPPTPVSLEGSPSTGTATGWAETPSLPQGWKYRLVVHPFSISGLAFLKGLCCLVVVAVFVVCVSTIGRDNKFACQVECERWSKRLLLPLFCCCICCLNLYLLFVFVIIKSCLGRESVRGGQTVSYFLFVVAVFVVCICVCCLNLYLLS